MTRSPAARPTDHPSDQPTDQPTDPVDDRPSPREDSVARWTATVSGLLDARRDLHGVHPMADLVYDAPRWSA